MDNKKNTAVTGAETPKAVSLVDTKTGEDGSTMADNSITVLRICWWTCWSATGRRSRMMPTT